MKSILSLTLLLKLFCSTLCNSQNNGVTTPSNQDKDAIRIGKELVNMLSEDQKDRVRIDSIRKVNSSKTNSSGTDNNFPFFDFKKPMTDAEVIDMVQKKDENRSNKLAQIIDFNGWPKVSVYGHKPANAAFILLQHSSLELQKKYYPLVESAALGGEAPLSNLAYLKDRILVREGKEQLYGTQFYQWNDGKPRLYPCFDMKNINSRRSEIGLNSIEEYAKTIGVELN